jgi:hypothetical protein
MRIRALEGAEAADARSASALPCLYSNNSNGAEVALGQFAALNCFTSGHKRTAFALGFNTRSFVEKWGLERVGFFTLTFSSHVSEHRIAQKAFNSLATGVLRDRYESYISVLERQRSSRIHYHLLLATGFDLRTGFDFKSIRTGDYRSAGEALRREWAFWRRKAPMYGFGRTELFPIESTVEGIALYVGKYISKHVGARRGDDKGARLVRYSKGSMRCSTRFAWNSVGGWLWRSKLGIKSAECGFTSLSDWGEAFGPKWAWALAESIMRVSMSAYPTIEHARADGRDVDGLPKDAVDLQWGVVNGVLANPEVGQSVNAS